MKIQNFNLNLLTLSSLLLTFFCHLASCIPRNQSQVNENCGLNGYEAHCVLDIMDEHIEATAVVNHCHIPLDITFRVVYRYGNGTEQRWQYTFVTTNQNERVLIPGLTLPPAPHALVYLFVRVPPTLFDLHNTSLAAVEVSFVAVISEDTWEEAEFLNEAITVTTTEDCYEHSGGDQDPLLWIIGGTFLGFLFMGAVTTGLLWCYRRRKVALDELALVNSLETGLPGAQPYQIGTTDQRLNNNNLQKESPKTYPGPRTNTTPKEDPPQETPKKNKLPAAFKFGRLREESPEELKERMAKKLNKAVVIGNPVLVDKTSVIQNRFNKMAPSSPVKSSPLVNLESVGDAFENVYSVEGERKSGERESVMETCMMAEEGKAQSSAEGRPVEGEGGKMSEGEIERLRKEETKQWKAHPLEFSLDDSSGTSAKNGARPKDKTPPSSSLGKD